MGIKDIFRTKRFKVNGRVLKIINRTKVEKKSLNKIYAIIQLFFSENRVARLLPRITIYIEEEEPALGAVAEKNAWVIPKELQSHAALHINALAIIGDFNTNKFIGTLVHEVGHILQEQLSHSLLRRNKGEERLKAILSKSSFKKNYSNISQDWILLLTEIRQYLYWFISALSFEGTATLLSDIQKQKIYFDDATKEALYQESEKSINNLIFSWKLVKVQVEAKNLQKAKENWDLMKKMIKVYAYSIGKYLAYTIYFYDEKIELREIALLKTQPFKFIREYQEQEILKGNKIPIVSLKKIGYLSYNNILAEWAALIEELKK